MGMLYDKKKSNTNNKLEKEQKIYFFTSKSEP